MAVVVVVDIAVDVLLLPLRVPQGCRKSASDVLFIFLLFMVAL